MKPIFRLVLLCAAAQPVCAIAQVFGRHWFARDWAVTYSVCRTRQGVAIRDAAGVGLRYRS